MLHAALVWLGRRASLVIAVGVFVGLLVPPLAAALRPLLLAGIVLPFLVALIRLDWLRLATHLRAPGSLLLPLVWLLLIQPPVAALMVQPLGLPNSLEAGVVLSATAPPLMASAALALILGLDAALAVLLTVAATALMPLTLPPLALLLLGVEIDIGAGLLMRRLANVVVGTFLMAWLLRLLLPRSLVIRQAQALDGVAVIGLLLFAIAIMDGVTAMLLKDPLFGLGCLLVVYAANLGFQILGATAFAWRGATIGLTIGLCSGNVNLGLLVAALGEQATQTLTVYTAMALFPIYTLPALLRPLYRRYFGAALRLEPPAEVAPEACRLGPASFEARRLWLEGRRGTSRPLRLQSQGPAPGAAEGAERLEARPRPDASARASPLDGDRGDPAHGLLEAAVRVP